MGRFNEAADPQMALAARAEGPRAPRQRKMAWHPHLLGAARPRRRGDRMIAPGKLARSSRWKTGPSKGYRPPGSECCVAPGEVAAKRTERLHTDLKISSPRSRGGPTS